MPRELEVIGGAYPHGGRTLSLREGASSRHTPGCYCRWDSQKGQPSKSRLQLPFFPCADARKASADGSQV